MARARVGRRTAPGARCHIGASAQSGYGWRLVAPNGRVVAVSAHGYPDFTACRSAFEDLRAHHAAHVGAMQHGPEANGWVWQLRSADGEAVAVAARPYERYSTCRSAFGKFCALLESDVAIAIDAG
ncbi:hypothetical protein [Streptomyces synnematoformans]|uniref:DUF1508 domain-containing protein n=1 Tax=Streptomyces synnematoformans TaxID=415721 RepID=A0ABN2YM47_9ACTN